MIALVGDSGSRYVLSRLGNAAQLTVNISRKFLRMTCVTMIHVNREKGTIKN